MIDSGDQLGDGGADRGRAAAFQRGRGVGDDRGEVARAAGGRDRLEHPSRWAGGVDREPGGDGICSAQPGMNSRLPRASRDSLRVAISAAIDRSSSAIAARLVPDKVPLAPAIISSCARVTALAVASSAVSAPLASALARSRLLLKLAWFAWVRPISEMRAAAMGSSEGVWIRLVVEISVWRRAIERARAAWRLVSMVSR